MIATPGRLVATGSQTVGPFFHFGLTTDSSLGRLVRPGTTGERIRLRIRVVDGDDVPVPDALVELYQSDAAGLYADTASPDGFSGFGRLPTDADGACLFETIRPGRVSDGHGGLQASHINVCLFMRGLLRHLYTRIYFAEDPALDADPLLALVAQARRATLIASPTPADPDLWTVEIRLQGEGETVFFDL